MNKLIALISLILASGWINAQVMKVQFPSLDNVQITGDYYPGETSDAPLIILCHQAGWSRGEYLEITPKLKDLGFSCLAIDQRSGDEVNDVVNETHQTAAKENKSTNYLDAEQDIVAALNYAKEAFPKKHQLILWGSSYSAALVLKIGAENKNVDAVISFSPGEYFSKLGKTDHFIADAASKLDKPVFITSAKDETGNWAAIIDAIPSDHKTGFIPKGHGKHGSRNLWEKFPDHQEYWDAIESFLYSL